MGWGVVDEVSLCKALLRQLGVDIHPFPQRYESLFPFGFQKKAVSRVNELGVDFWRGNPELSGSGRGVRTLIDCRFLPPNPATKS